MLHVEFKSNVTQVLKQAGTTSQKVMNDLANKEVEWVQEQILYGYHDPHGADGHTEIVDTGKLFDGIQAEVTRDSQNTYTTTVGSDRKYAVYVHNGTYKLKARRFITDTLQKRQGEIRAILKQAFSS